MLSLGLVLSIAVGAVHAQPQPTALKLNNGLVFQYASFGLEVYDDDTATNFTLTAIQAGFRNFFTSVLAGNQMGFGRAVAQSPVPRAELFICGSVDSGGMCSGVADCQSVTTQGWKDNLVALNLTYLDMIMLDYPARDCDSITGQWRAFEDMLSQNLTRSIAVSNFQASQLDCLLNFSRTGAPQVNQMRYSVGDYASPVLNDNTKRNVVLQAYSPLNGGQLVNDPDCVAIGLNHNKSAAQVALRWIIQMGATFTTSATTAQQFAQDIALFDFVLTTAEMAVLNNKTHSSSVSSV